MGITTGGRIGSYRKATIRSLWVIVLFVGATIASQLVFLTHFAQAAPGCSDYVKQEECSTEAYWKDGKLMYGEDELTPKSPSKQEVKEIEKKKGGKYDFYKVSTSLGRRNAYIAIPANYNPGDTFKGAFLVSIKRDVFATSTIQYKDGISVHKNKEEHDKAIDKKTKELRDEAAKVDEEIREKQEDCDKLTTGGVDIDTIKKCLQQVEALTNTLQNLNKDARANEEKKEENDSSFACNIGDIGVGWLVCPASNFLALLTDGSFKFLETFLKYETLANDEARKAMHDQWALVRNIANFVFIIAFLVVIYSHLTGVGISNYHVKRMLPRLIVGAVLINLSFLFSGALVDASNVAGSGIKSLIEGAIPDTGSGLGTKDWGGLIATILAGGVAVKASGGQILALAIPALIIALLAILTVLIILLARQALITILIVISPLAFVAFLLPNTSKWFDRWRKSFVSMLLIYPIIAVVFAGSKFAAAIVKLGDEGVVNNLFLGITALAIQTIPLFIVPAILKASGGVLQRLGMMTNDKTKGILDRGKNRAQEIFDINRQNRLAIHNREQKSGKKKKAGWYISDLDRQQKREMTKRYADQNYEHSRAQYEASYYSNEENALKAAGGDRDTAAIIQARATAGLQEQDDKIITAMAQNTSGLDNNQLIERIEALLNKQNGQHSYETAALMKNLIKNGNLQDVAPLVDKINGLGSSITSKTTASELASQKGWALSGSTIPQLSAGKMDKSFNQAVAENVSAGSISPQIASQLSADDVNFISNIDLGEKHLELQNSMQEKAKKSIDAALNNSNLNAQISKSRDAMNEFTGRPPGDMGA